MTARRVVGLTILGAVAPWMIGDATRPHPWPDDWPWQTWFRGACILGGTVLLSWCFAEPEEVTGDAD